MCDRKLMVQMYNGKCYADRGTIEAEVKCGDVYCQCFNGVAIARCTICEGINTGNEEQYLFINGNGWDEFMSEQEWVAGITAMHFSVDCDQPYLDCYALHGQLYSYEFIVEYHADLPEFAVKTDKRHIWFDHLSGCYFEDESDSGVYGPYCTIHECTVGFRKYCAWLDNEDYDDSLDRCSCHDIEDFDNEDRMCLMCGRGHSGCDNRNEVTDRNADSNMDIVASNGAVTEYKCTALGMAAEWLSDPLNKDMRGGFTEQVIRQLIFELNVNQKLVKNYREMVNDMKNNDVPF